MAYPVLAQVSLSYSEPKGTFPRVTHPSATDTEVPVRLACVKPAASVRSEPGSSSQVEELISAVHNINGVLTSVARSVSTPEHGELRNVGQPHLSRSGNARPARTKTSRPRFSFSRFTCQRARSLHPLRRNSPPKTRRQPGCPAHPAHLQRVVSCRASDRSRRLCPAAAVRGV